MTKKGFKQVMLSIDTWKILSDKAKEQKTSIDGVLKGLTPSITNLSLCQAEPPRLRVKALALKV
jgi:hypothetical protein